MALETTINRVSYAGNGLTVDFSFPYYFLANADLVVIKRVNATGVETLLTLGVDYQVTGAGVPAGGLVSIGPIEPAPPVGTTLTIYRENALLQDLNLVENDPMPAEELEERFDKSMMIDQRLDNRMDRAVRLSEGYSAAFDPTLPTLLAAGDTIVVNAGVTGFEAGAAAPIPAALVALLAYLGEDFIPPTAFDIADNQVVPADIDGCLFSAPPSIGAILEVQYVRGSGPPRRGVILFYVLWDTLNWYAVDQEEHSVGGIPSGITLSITTGGQVQYTTDLYDVGIIVFNARTTDEP